MTAGSVYDQAVEVMARASLSSRRDTMGHMQAEDLHRLYMTAALDALLAVPRMIDCPTCGGTGEVLAGGSGAVIPMVDCKACKRTGSVPSTDPLVILGPKRVRRLDITDADDGSLRSGEPTVSVYREGTPDES